MDKKLCKECNLVKQHVPNGNFPNNKDKKWKDEDGLLWNGKVCGKCNQVRLKTHMQIKRKGVEYESKKD